MHHGGPWTQCRLEPDESTAVFIDFDAVGPEQRSGRLGGEERVAETRVEDDIDQLGIGHGADGIGDQRPDVGPIEWLEIDGQATTLLFELLDEAFEFADLCPRRGRVVAITRTLLCAISRARRIRRATESLSASWRSSHTITTVSTSASSVTRSNSALSTSRGTSSR